MSAKPSTSAVPGSIFYLASLLFLISGGTGLVYQVVWFRRFSHVWGSSSLAFAAVGGSFLFGLGLGAYLFGRYADRVTSPLRWYGACELAIGIAALLIPLEIAALVDASVGLYASIPEQPLARYLVQFVITLIVIGPPCALMGGTLPLLIRELTARKGSLDQATGWLYAVNTFGAAAGCYLTGFHFLPSFGLPWTNNMAAAVNITIGLVAMLLGQSADRRVPDRVKPATATDPVSTADSLALSGLYAAAALSGCGALILEMTWSRQAALILGGSTYAYTATLFVVLLGIGAGSLLFHGVLRRVASWPFLPLAIVATLVIATLAGKLSLPWLSLAVAPQSVRDMRGDQLANGAICAAVSAALELIPALAMGVLFPLFVHMTRAGAAHVGSAVGKIYAWNTLGSIAGASLTSILLFPRIGTAGALALGVGMYVVALLAVVPWRTTSGLASGAGAAVVGAAIVVAIAQPTDPRRTNLGFYIYGDPRVASDGPAGDEDIISGIKTLFFREGASSNVLVTARQKTNFSLRVNGKVDASTNVDMENQLGLAYLPQIFQPNAREILVIGFGSGCTSGASLLFPGTRVTCCEIEPAVYEASAQFAGHNHRPQEKSRRWLLEHNAALEPGERLTAEQIDARARFSLVFGDGRTAVQGSDKKFDLIISEPSNPWVAGVSNLFTAEYFRTAREHLTDGGLLAAWIQTYNFTMSDYAMVARTLHSEFPYYGVLIFSGGVDTVVLASNRPLLPDAEQIAALQKVVDRTPAITSDLNLWFGGSDLRLLLLKYYHLGNEQLDRLVKADGSHALNTDLHLRLEFDAPLYLFKKVPPRESAAVVLRGAVDPRFLDSVAARIGVKYDSADCQQQFGHYLLKQLTNPGVASHLVGLGQIDRAAAHFERALALDADNVEAYRGLARVRRLQDRRKEAAEMFAVLIEKRPEDASSHAELATEFLYQKQPEKAIRFYREALRLAPSVSHDNLSDSWANNLAWALATSPDEKLRNPAEALEWARKACEANDYQEPAFLDTLAAALARNGQFDEAIKICKQLIELPSAPAQLVNTTKDRIWQYEAHRPYQEE